MKHDQFSNLSSGERVRASALRPSIRKGRLKSVCRALLCCTLIFGLEMLVPIGAHGQVTMRQAPIDVERSHDLHDLHNPAYDLMRSYDPALTASCGSLIASTLLFAPLGPYRFPAGDPDCAPKQPELIADLTRAPLDAAQARVAL